MDTLLRDLQSFVGEHRRCGELDGGVEGRAGVDDAYGPRMVRLISARGESSSGTGRRRVCYRFSRLTSDLVVNASVHSCGSDSTRGSAAL